MCLATVTMKIRTVHKTRDDVKHDVRRKVTSKSTFDVNEILAILEIKSTLKVRKKNLTPVLGVDKKNNPREKISNRDSASLVPVTYLTPRVGFSYPHPTWV